MIGTAFVEGFLLGLGAAVPLGPINVLIMGTALRSYPAAVLIGLGALSADMTYLVLTLFGLLHLFSAPAVMETIGYVGVVVLLYITWKIWKGRHAVIAAGEVEVGSLAGQYLKGYSLTLLNPYTLMFWFSVSTYVASKEADAVMMLLGLLCAIMLWVTLMPLVIHRSRHLVSQRMVTWFSLFSVGVLLFFAAGMLGHLAGV